MTHVSVDFATDTRRRASVTIFITIAVGTLFTIQLWVVALGSISATKTTALDHARLEAHNLAAAFADEVAHSLDGVTAAMEIVAQRMRASPGHFDIYNWAYEIPVLSFGTIQGSIIGPDGRLLSTTTLPNAEPVDLADREHFRVHLDGKFKGIFIGKPVVGRVSHKTTIQVSRRVDAADGSFLGVIVFSLSPDSLTSLHKLIDLGPRGTLALIGLDDVVRARFDHAHPDGLAGIGQSIAGSPRPAIAGTGAEGFYVRKSVIDGIKRQYSYRHVGNYPVLVTVGLGLDEILVAPRRHELVVLLIAGTATVILIGLAVFLIGEIRQRSANEIALAEEHAKLEADIALRE